jgi:hypothetical protein
MERRRATSALGVFLTLVFTSTLSAQKTTGDITGTVTDAIGGILPGVTMNAVCTDTNLSRAAVTDAQGGFRISELPICVYRVTAELQGFKTVSRETPIAANAVAKVDFKLEVGTMSETITVEAVTPLVEFSDKLNTRIDSQRIEAMPLSGRDFNSLLNVMPGVQHRPGGGFQGVNISGARTSSNNFMIDGISNNDRYYGDTVMNQTAIIGIPATLVPMDAIGDFTVQQTPSAEFGVKGGAAVNIVMKSGGNVAHGTGYYFRHDDWTDKPNFFDVRAAQKLGKEADPTPIKNQQYGGTFGGPIQKDKTFIFGYYEGQRLTVTTPYDVHVPTDAQIAAARSRIAAAGLRTNPIGENLIKFYPTDPTGNLHVLGATVANMNTFSVKLDHQLNASNLINERVFYGRSFQSAPAGNSGEIVPPSAAGPVDLFNSVTDPTLAALTGVVWNSTLSNRTLLETRFGFNYFSQTIEPNNKIDPKELGINTGPLDAADLGVPGVNTPFGHIGGIAGYPITTAPTTNLQLSATLTHTRSAHTLKMGASWDNAYNRSVRNQARTSLTANGRSSGDVDALVGLLLARFENASRSFGATERHMSQKSIGAFINDDWKVSSRLTLSAGVRYEIFTPISERDNLATNFFPDRGGLVQLGSNGLDRLYKADTNNFGPRAGLAWDPTGNGRTSVRVGYALTYDNPQIGVVHPGLFSTPTLGVFRVSFAQSPRTVPDAVGVTCLDPNNSAAGGDYVCLQPGVPVFGSSPTGAPPFNIFRVPDDFHSGYYHYFHATVQRELGRMSSVTVSYVGSRGKDLVWRKEINAPLLGSPTTSPDLIRPFRAQYPQFRSIVEYTNDSKSWYDSLQLSFRQNNWHGINTQYNYTLSTCTDYNSGNRDGASEQAMNPYDPSNNEGPCNADIRHNFNFGGSYAVPRASIGGGPLQIGAVLTALSGRPFTPGVGTFDQSGQNTGTLRADCLESPIYNYGLDYLFPDPNTSLSAITNASTAFATPANGRLGTCGRNSGRGPKFTQLDLNILKEFRLQGNKRLQARWEIFNLTNRVNLGGFLSSSVRSGSFGKIGSTPDVDRGNPVLGTGGPRAMQWALKVLF